MLVNVQDTVTYKNFFFLNLLSMLCIAKQTSGCTSYTKLHSATSALIKTVHFTLQNSEKDINIPMPDEGVDRTFTISDEMS